MKNLFRISVMLLLTVNYACDNKTTEENKETEEKVVIDVNTLNLNNLVAEIKKREKAYENPKSLNRRESYELMEAYVAYEDRFGNRENAPEYLFQAARIAMSEELTVEAIRYFDRVYNEYPKFEQRAVALFYKAFVLENLAKNLEEAKTAYESFISEYPTHEFADDAQASLNNLGKSAEEIIRGFEIQDSIRKANGEV